MPLLTPAQTFARLEKAHAAWTRGGASITVSSTVQGATKRATYRLDLDGSGGASLHLRTPAREGMVATDQSFLLRGDRVIGIDYSAEESLRRSVSSRGAVGTRFASVLGGLEDAVGFLASPEVRTRYLRPLERLSGWKIVSQGLERRTAKGHSFSRLSLDGTGRLKNFHLELPGSKLDWTFTYGAYRPTTVPPGFQRVESFTLRPLPPRYADAAAKRAGERAFRAASRIKNGIVRIDDQATVWVAGSRIRYERQDVGFAYDGRTLTVRTANAAYQGRSGRNGALDRVATLLGSVDPVVRTLLVRTPLYGELFSPGTRIRLVGTMASGGQPCDVLAIENRAFKATMFARRSDGLPASVEAEPLDGRGRPVGRNVRTLAWSSVGSPLSPSLFVLRLPPGKAALPLPKLKLTGP